MFYGTKVKFKLKSSKEKVRIGLSKGSIFTEKTIYRKLSVFKLYFYFYLYFGQHYPRNSLRQIEILIFLFDKLFCKLYDVTNKIHKRKL